MFSIIFKSVKEAAEEYGCLTAIIAGIILLAFVFGIDCLIVWACMALWNACLVPLLAGTALAIGEIGFWSMFGIYLLFGFLFRMTTNTSNN
jgi:hypothetical protein